MEAQAWVACSAAISLSLTGSTHLTFIPWCLSELVGKAKEVTSTSRKNRVLFPSAGLDHSSGCLPMRADVPTTVIANLERRAKSFEYVPKVNPSPGLIENASNGLQ